MKLLNLELTEKINTDVTFDYFPDFEGDDNRGFQIDKIEASLDGKEAGYLKIGYIPKDRFDARYSNILNFLCNMEGQVSILPYAYRNLDYHNIPPEDLRRTMWHAYSVGFGYVDNETGHQLEQMPLDQVIPTYEKIEKAAKKRYGLRYRQFKNYYVDKAYVDYIRVFPDFQRNGIGTALYRAGYEWMKKKGIPFYASGTQTAEAKAIWQKMSQEYPVAHDPAVLGNRKFTRQRFNA
jgi:GNAT superfamily N-acetyltransferase